MLFHGWKFAQQMPSHSQSILPFIQVKQNKISCDKCLQIPAINLEITSRKFETGIYLEPLQIQLILKKFMARGTTPHDGCARHISVASYFTACTLLLIKLLRALIRWPKHWAGGLPNYPAQRLTFIMYILR
jgi:hypothetical protein